MDEEHNVHKLRANYDIMIENLICECGSETFFISKYLKAVCTECRGFMDSVDLEGNHR